MKKLTLLITSLLFAGTVTAQQPPTLQLPSEGEKLMLHSNWHAKNATYLHQYDGYEITVDPQNTATWLPATVPGTVLTTLIDNGIFPNPLYEMNNERIPDANEVGIDFYTYWFINQFNVAKKDDGRRIWLNFRGINYKAEIFLNGERIAKTTHEGMFLRKSFDITDIVRYDKPNILGVLVFPPDPAGGTHGQAGNGLIARSNTMQFTAGWDWIQPVKDRNTGIWDEVTITTTGNVKLANPLIVTKVPGERMPNAKSQADAIIKVSTDLTNLTDKTQAGELTFKIDGKTYKKAVTLAPNQTTEVSMADVTIKNPRLWWAHGMGGKAELYDAEIAFVNNGKVSDEQSMRVGIREITSAMDNTIGGRVFKVNGQRLFMRGGNYICSEWMLRLSPERYYSDVLFHKEMNINMIRVWGGAIPERPEFYNACDELGMLVFQDIQISGDGNGAWLDPMKKESYQRRREYPDNHDLFVASITDNIKMLRNHASLAIWCGGNEWAPAPDIDKALRPIFAKYDPERFYLPYSTSDELTKNIIGGVGDGPYGMMEPEWFFTFRSNAFNPELGSSGVPEVETMREIMSDTILAYFPQYRPKIEKINSGGMPQYGRENRVWSYHQMSGYGDFLDRYRVPETIEDYCKVAQVVNYEQYRAFMEGWASHMWEWYTGGFVWKTQNPWTALRGQMYDYYHDPNGCLYGMNKGGELLHVQYNPVSQAIELVNITPTDAGQMTVKATLYGTDGKIIKTQDMKSNLPNNSVQRLDKFEHPTFGILWLEMRNAAGELVSDNAYLLTDKEKDYTAINNLPKATVSSKMTYTTPKDISLTVTSDGNLAYFNRVKVFSKKTGKRILPIHYSDNYFTLLPGGSKTIDIALPEAVPASDVEIVVEGWNVDKVSF